MAKAPANLYPVRLRQANASSEARLSRLAELIIALLLILFTMPLMVIVCLAIKLDSPGPVFHRQPRLARDGRRFFVFKFRTTMHEPDWVFRPLWGRGTRETRVGPFLRYSRIEDLPQLVNVVRGEMTLLGSGAERPMFTD